jgi:hypothetical protein
MQDYFERSFIYCEPVVGPALRRCRRQFSMMLWVHPASTKDHPPNASCIFLAPHSYPTFLSTNICDKRDLAVQYTVFFRNESSMVGLREQPFSSYRERKASEAHSHPRPANCLHNPLHTQSFYHPNVSLDAKTSQEVSRLSFAYTSVCAAQQVPRLLVVSERSRGVNLPSV